MIAMKVGQRAVLMFGFEKKDMANIRPDELKSYKKAAKIYLGFSDEEISEIVRAKALIEISPAKEGVANGKSVQERSTRGTARKHV